MGEHPKKREPQLARTDFESMTHEQLAAMLNSASTEGASHLSSKLSKAASTITKIGDDLMKHVKDLEWQGEGGDAFRDWGGQTASSTLRLGQYAEVASRWMGTVSQAIAEAKAAMPDTSETTKAKADLADAHKTIAAAKQPGAHNDPDARQLAQTAQTDATAAQKRIDAARYEAVQQMQKLAQSYEYSAQQVNSVTPPTFSPPAGRTGPDSWWHDDSEHISAASGGSTTANRVSAGSAAGLSGAAHHSTAQPIHTGTQTVIGHGAPEHTSREVRPSQPVDMGIDSADTLPRSSPPPVSPTPTTTSVPHREVPLPHQPTAIPPTFSGGGREFGSTPPARVPTSGRLPQVPGVVKPTGSVPRMPRETGIVGGRPVTNTGRPTNGIPRGTVIGKENVQGRTPMGRGMSPGVPAGGAARSGSGVAGGRRLASETGGVVGNRPALPGRNSGRPFTAGGSGLVRPSSNANEAAHGSAVGRTGVSGQTPGSRNGQQRDGERPDYLVEDEETWTRDSRRTLPPVVD
ncbi:WXG100 family type VII secretion target [Streptomyces sp. NPDC001340]